MVRQTYLDIALVRITGRHEIVDRVRARGVRRFLRKPFDGDALLAAVRGALDEGPD
jgi:DNA-binding response OmpR family regulator